MTTFPGSPRVLKGALVSVDPLVPIPNVIVFQYNPDTLTRTLKPRSAGGGARAGRSAAADRAARRDDQGRCRDRRGRPARTQRRDREHARHLSANLGARDAELPEELACDRQHRTPRHRRHRDRPADRTLDAVHLGAAADPAGSRHRLRDHRGSARPGAEPDPRQGRPGLAGAQLQRSVDHQPRLFHFPRASDRQGNDERQSVSSAT